MGEKPSQGSGTTWGTYIMDAEPHPQAFLKVGGDSPLPRGKKTPLVPSPLHTTLTVATFESLPNLDSLYQFPASFTYILTHSFHKYFSSTHHIPDPGSRGQVSGVELIFWTSEMKGVNPMQGPDTGHILC